MPEPLSPEIIEKGDGSLQRATTCALSPGGDTSTPRCG
jgi:hypothetical protein